MAEAGMVVIRAAASAAAPTNKVRFMSFPPVAELRQLPQFPETGMVPARPEIERRRLTN
jgi:hypothetical protein